MPATDTGRPTEERPLRSPAFRWFLGGQSISLAGSAMSPVALAFGVLEATGSAAWLSAVTTAALVPMVAALLLGGGIADRYRRDTVLRLTGLGAGLTQAGVAFVLLTHQHPMFLLPLSALGGVFQGLTKPALRGIVVNPAEGRGIQRASSLLASVRNTTKILRPHGSGPADRFPGRRLGDRRGRRVLPPWIWSVTVAFAVFNALNMGVWQILGPVIADGTIGAQGWGVVLSARGVGALLASVVMVRLTVRRPMVPALASMSLGGVPLILLGTGADTVWPAAAAFVAGVAAEFFTVGAHEEFWSFVPLPVGQRARRPTAEGAFLRES